MHRILLVVLAIRSAELHEAIRYTIWLNARSATQFNCIEICSLRISVVIGADKNNIIFFSTIRWYYYHWWRYGAGPLNALSTLLLAMAFNEFDVLIF